MPALIVVAVLCGFGVGWFVAARRVAPATAPTVPAVVPAATETSSVAVRPGSDGVRSAVDRLKIGVAMCDPSLQVTYRNDAANALEGTHGGLIVNRELMQVFAATRSGQPQSRVVELHGPPKTTFLVESVPTPDGGAVATINDISERVRVESMRTDFVANISHELKTPVGAIAVLAEMLADERDPETVANLAERVIDESHRAARTIDDLLELSRIESSGRLDDVVDLGGLIDSAVTRGRLAAHGRGVEVEAIAPTRPIRVSVDRAQVASAIGNLVENAVKYSNDGGKVQVRVRRDERWLEVMVADQGVGIPERDLDRVFERFYRVDKARARETGGTGLGLAIVRHVAGNHGGEVSCSSTLGEGSTFVFRLPARLVVSPDVDPTPIDERALDRDALDGDRRETTS